MKLLCGTLAGLGILVSGIALAGTTYYVGPAGDDTNDGITLPWATIQHGVESLSQGDTLIVQEGIYYEPQGIMIDNDSNPNISGTETEPTRIVAQGNVEIVVDPGNKAIIMIEGVSDGYIQHITINGFNLKNPTEDGGGIYAVNTSNCTFSNNYFSQSKYGILLVSSTLSSIINNQSSQCTTGILLKSSSANLIQSNICLYGLIGISLEDSSNNNLIDENICSENVCYLNNYPRGGHRSNAESAKGSSGISIRSSNNVIIQNNLLEHNYNKYNGVNTAGIWVSGFVSDIAILNNIFVENSLHIMTSNSIFNYTVANNLFHDSPLTFRTLVEPDNDSMITLTNNTILSNLTYYTHYETWIAVTDVPYYWSYWYNSLRYLIWFPAYYSLTDHKLVNISPNLLKCHNNIIHSSISTPNTFFVFDFYNNDTFDANNIDYNFFTDNITMLSNLNSLGSNNIISSSPLFRNTAVHNVQLLPESPCRAPGFNNHTMGIYGGEYAIIDTDNDGMPDDWEIRYYLNTTAQDDAVDSDNDGLTNYQEFFYKLNPQDNDSDNDGLPDNEIIVYGTSPYYCDSDFDTLSDYEEVMIHHTNPLSPDSDGDGLSDYTEINGWTNGQGTFYTSPNDPDSDDDKLKDGSEKSNNANPFITDTDNDGLSDYNEVTARVYIGYIYYTSDPSVADTDNDGASDYEEDQAHTNPRDPMFNPTHSPTVTIIDWDYYTEFTLRGSASGSNSGAAIENVLFCIKAGSPSDEEYELALINGGAGTDNVQFVITKELFEYAYNLYIKTYDADGYYGIQYFSLNNTINNPYLDSDGDGINNWEETHIYHSNPFAKDTDNDGQNDRLEVWAGSDPNNSESVFTHSISHNINGDILISWNCLTGRVYSVLVSDEPDGVYVPLMTEITNNTNGEISVIDSGLDENNNEYHDEEDIYPPYLEYELVSRRCYKIAVEMPE